MSKNKQLVSDKENEILTEDLRSHVRELKSRITELRKEGHNPSIADFHLRSLDSKLRWAQYTRKQEDYEVIKNILKFSEEELIEESRLPLVDIKAEVERKIKEKLNEEKAQAFEEAMISKADGARRTESSSAQKQEVSDAPEARLQSGMKENNSNREDLDIKEENSNEATSTQRTESSSVQKETSYVPEVEPQNEPVKPENTSEETVTTTESDKLEVEPQSEVDETVTEPKLELVIDPEKFFRLKSGKLLTSIQDLITALSFMNPEDFEFHTRNYDNDFSMWIEFVFHQPELAKNIKGIRDKRIMSNILKEKKEVDNGFLE